MAEPRSMKVLRSKFNFATPEDLVKFSLDRNAAKRLLAAHAVANSLAKGVFSDTEIHNFLVDERRVKKYLDKFLPAMIFFVGSVHHQQSAQPPFFSNDDHWGDITVLLRFIHRSIDPAFFKSLHEITIFLTALGYFATRDDAGLLLDCLFRKNGDGTEDKENTFLFSLHCLICKEVALEFPMVRRLALSLWSVILCRRPTVAFSFQDWVLRVVSSYTGFACKLSDTLQEQLCSGYNDNIDIMRNVAGFLNCVPGLYCMVAFKPAMSPQGDFRALVTILLRFIHDMDTLCARALWDKWNTVAKLPSFENFLVTLKLLLCNGDKSDGGSWRIDLLENHFCHFAPAVALELLSWWVYREPSLLEFTFSWPCDRECSIKKILTRTTVFACIANESNDLKYIEKIRNDLINGKVPRLPPVKKSLLRGPFMDVNRHCGLPSCRISRNAEGGCELMRCNGGCCGFEHYCCKIHQVEDWPRHKKFCKAVERHWPLKAGTGFEWTLSNT